MSSKPSRPILIDQRPIGESYPPFIIAEMSGNHNQSLSRALKIIESAASAGADAVKLQTLNADTITLPLTNGDFLINDPQSLWQGQSLHDLYLQAQTPWVWHRALIEKSRQMGILCFSSPFDEAAVDFLEDLNVPAYKIASFENNHLPLIRKAASTGKPLFISTGMATGDELEEAVAMAREAGCNELILLKCNSSYPAKIEESNLRTIDDMKKRYHCEIGLSDHSMSNTVPLVAIAQGATVIEKHFTLSRADGGVDSDFSLQPDELKSLVDESKNAWKSLGKISYEKTPGEVKSSIFRRSLYIAEDMKKGDTFTDSNLRIIRPGNGLAPKFQQQILGKQIARDTAKGTAMTWDLLKECFIKS